ncbi:MAG: Trk system potassium transporter TrkA [Candidatus Gastranaerophilales bacterium]|nr:Trk system potassium transporter TrkA [Candidatus Gastranaerophilales bacterium]
MKIIIYGANSMAAGIAAEFFEDHDIIVIDPIQKNLDSFANLDIGIMLGDALNIKVLKQADVMNSDCFIAVSDNDESNIISCLMARQISNAQTICFVRKKESMESLNSLKDEYKSSYAQYIDHIIWPQKLLVQEIFKIITVPDALDVENFAKGRARLFEYRIKEDSELINKKLKDCYFNSEVLVVGIVRNDELFIPNGDSEFKQNDKAILMGSPIGLDIAASELFEAKGKVKKIAIIGGGSVGYELALALEKTKMRSKIIEINYKRCETLSQNLKNTLLLHGSGTSLELLEQEEIGRCDVVVAITNNDEKNLLCSLLSKQLGAKKIITRVSENATANLFERVGVDVAISQRDACITEIKNRIIETRAGVIATVERGQGEIVELALSQNFVQKPLWELKTPANCVVAIIKRGSKVIIPKGKTEIKPLDTLLVFTKTNDAQSIKEYFK